MSVKLPELPYGKEALAPYISAGTLEIHHGKHHDTYVQNLNKLIEGGGLTGESLETIIRRTAGNPDQIAVFNNAAQVWNHTFYWHSMKPGGGGKPTGPFGEKIRTDFGGYDAFVQKFKDAAITQFGSGWAWLVIQDGKLAIQKTSNADTPVAHDVKPLLTIDVWEHAYYLDYQNRRGDYVDSFINHLVNWDFANSQMV